jgi:hypothetical protein
MTKFERQWKYQSYRPDPGSLAADPNPPTFVRWSPPGMVTIDEGGTTGKLVFTGTPIMLDLKFQITDGSPEGLYISAIMNLPNGKQFTNELQGWFVPAKLREAVDEANNPLVVRGSIVQTSEDIAPPPARQPMFTTGSSSWSHCHSPVGCG